MGLEKEVFKESHAARLELYQRVSEKVEPIPELTKNYRATYRVVSVNSRLEEILGDAKVVIVAGGFFGDEGKGKAGNASLQYLVRKASFLRKAGKNLASFLTERESSLLKKCGETLSNYLGEEESSVVAIRAGSGANTGRTAYDQKGKKHVFHVIPSAILHGIECHVGSQVTFDPISLTENELNPLRDKDISLEDLTFGNSYLTNAYHRIADILASKKNGSTCVGIKWSAASKVTKSSTRLNDLFGTEENLKSKIKEDMLIYNGLVTEFGGANEVHKKLKGIQKTNQRVVPEHVLEFAKLYAESDIDSAIDFLATKYLELVKDENSPLRQRISTKELTKKSLKANKKILLEGTQAYFLSNKIEQFFGGSTSSDTTAFGTLSDAGINPSEHKTTVVSILKGPIASKVGAIDAPFSFCPSNLLSEAGVNSLADLGGWFEDYDVISNLYFRAINKNGLVEPFKYGAKNANKTIDCDIGAAMAMASAKRFDEAGATTKRPRITGFLDLLALKQVVDDQGPNIFLSALDRADLCRNVGLVVAYAVSLPAENTNENKFTEDEKGLYIDCNGEKYRSGDIIKIGDRIPNSHVLEHCLPIVKVMSGGKDSDQKLLSSKDPTDWEGKNLPKYVSDYLATIEDLTGAKIFGIGIGPNDHEALYLKRN